MLIRCASPARNTLTRRGITSVRSGVLDQYNKLVDDQKLQSDPRQLYVAEHLQQLQDKLAAWQPPCVETYDEWINQNPLELNASDADVIPGLLINLPRHCVIRGQKLSTVNHI